MLSICLLTEQVFPGDRLVMAEVWLMPLDAQVQCLELITAVEEVFHDFGSERAGERKVTQMRQIKLLV